MNTLVSILVVAASLANLVVFIMVLIKLFQKEGALKGILGIICSLYTYIWGWINHREQGITTLMWVWTGLIVLNIILGGALQTTALQNVPQY